MRVAVLVVLAACGRLGFEPDAHLGDAIAADAAAPDTVASQDLVAWYPLDVLNPGGAGASTDDATGNGHTATCAIGRCPTVVPGRVGNAMQFDGANARLDVAGALDLETATGFTVVFFGWFEAGTGNVQCAVNKQYGAANNNAWQACLEPDQTLLFDVSGPNGGINSNATLSLAAWHQVAIAWDGTVMSITFDGTVVQTGSDSVLFDEQGMSFGADLDSGVQTAPMTGILDDVRVYRRLLSAAELAQLRP